MLLSGGLDSTTCVHFLLAQKAAVHGLFVDYSQAAARPEEQAARNIATLHSIPLTIIRIGDLEPSKAGELVGRNSLLISAALFWSRGRQAIIATGIHAGTNYYDCSERFLQRMNSLVLEQSNGRVSLLTPFMTWTKRDIFDYATRGGVPISQTYSCENGTQPPCGKCASCRERGALTC